MDRNLFAQELRVLGARLGDAAATLQSKDYVFADPDTVDLVILLQEKGVTRGQHGIAEAVRDNIVEGYAPLLPSLSAARIAELRPDSSEDADDPSIVRAQHEFKAEETQTIGTLASTSDIQLDEQDRASSEDALETTANDRGYRRGQDYSFTFEHVPEQGPEPGSPSIQPPLSRLTVHKVRGKVERVLTLERFTRARDRKARLLELADEVYARSCDGLGAFDMDPELLELAELVRSEVPRT